MASSGLLVSVGTIAAIWALFAIGLNIKFGYTGLLDFGHVVFFLIGAYTTALLVAPPADTRPVQTYILGLDLAGRVTEFTGYQLAGGVGWGVALLAATVLAGAFGLLIALPAIRLREDYLAIALLGISVIVKRTVQTESWLANGPDALRGFDRPLQGLFPLPGDTLEGSVLMGLVAFVFWSIGTFLLTRATFLDAGTRSSASLRSRILNATFAALTLGIGYLAARHARRSENGNGRSVSLRPVFGAAAAFGALATAITAAGYPTIALLVVIGLFSAFVWVFAAAAAIGHFDRVTRRDALVAFGLALGPFIAFTPARRFGTGPLGSGGLIPTLVLLGAYLLVAGHLLRNWSRFGQGSSALSILGVVGVWLFAFRYFLLAPVAELAAGNVGAAINALVVDLLFLVEFAGTTVTDGLLFDYSRFVFTLAVTFLGIGYLLSEITVRSPFGRVLKAIREDEDVAMALGKNTFSYKVQSMVLGSAMAGLAGGMAAIYYGTLTFRNFDPLYTFFMFLIVVIGGTANNKGVILGAALYWAFVQGSNDVASALPTGASAIFSLRIAFLGVIFIALLYYRPQGIWGEERLMSEGDG